MTTPPIDSNSARFELYEAMATPLPTISEDSDTIAPTTQRPQTRRLVVPQQLFDERAVMPARPPQPPLSLTRSYRDLTPLLQELERREGR